MKFLVTGAAGFIGYHLCKRLLEGENEVLGIDNFNEYYDPRLKQSRVANLSRYKSFQIVNEDISEMSTFGCNFDVVVNLAAYPGVRYSIGHPEEYIRSNILGFFNILRFVKEKEIKNFVYASTSSVYGSNLLPWKETQFPKNPPSLYAATKICNEVLADSYVNMFGINCTGVRYFTVYGPWGRPDMAMWLWTEAILNGEPIEIFNNGKMTRCFTYVSDIVEGTMCAIKRSFEIKGHNVFNLGSDVPVNIEKVADFIGKYLGKEVKKRYLPNQIGDISDTEADLSFSRKELGFDPKVAIEQGIPEFLNWYKKFYDK